MNEPTPTERDEAIRLLVAKIPKETLANILMLMQNKQTPWHLALHFGLGLQVRNALREAGYNWGMSIWTTIGTNWSRKQRKSPTGAGERDARHQVHLNNPRPT